MKRSKFINQVYEKVKALNLDGYSDSLFKSVELTITIAEEMGMLPPKARFPGAFTTEDDLGNIHPPSDIIQNKWEEDLGCISDEFNEWEAENPPKSTDIKELFDKIRSERNEK